MLLHSFKSIILLFHILCLHAVQTIGNTPELSCLRHLLHTNVMTIISIRFSCFSCCILHKMCFIWHLVQEFLTTELFRSLSSVIKPSLVNLPPNHIPKCHIYTSLKYPRGRWLSCFLGQPPPVLGNPLNHGRLQRLSPSTVVRMAIKGNSALYISISQHSQCFHYYPM